jgi:hypothetical protein
MRLLSFHKIGKKGVEETTKQIVLLIIFAIVLIAFVLALLPNLQAVTWGQFVSAFNTYHLTIIKAIAYKQSLAGPMNVPDGFFIVQVYGGDNCKNAFDELAVSTQGKISSYAAECDGKFCICGGRLNRRDKWPWWTKNFPKWLTNNRPDSFPSGYSDALAECQSCTTYDSVRTKLDMFCGEFFWDGFNSGQYAREIFTGVICHALATPTMTSLPPYIATNITGDPSQAYPLMWIYKEGGVTIQSHYVERQEPEAYYLNSSFVIY